MDRKEKSFIKSTVLAVLIFAAGPARADHRIYLTNQSEAPLTVRNETPGAPPYVTFTREEPQDADGATVLPGGAEWLLAPGQLVSVDLVPVHAHHALFGLHQGDLRLGTLHYLVAMPEDEAEVALEPLDGAPPADWEVVDGDIFMYFGLVEN